MQDRYRSGAYADANPDWHDADGVHKARAIADWLVRLAPRRVIDVGCGTGAVLAELASVLPHATLEGWDIAPRAVARAEARGVHVSLGDPVAAGRRADVALVLDVLEHVPDDAEFLVQLRDVAPMLVLRLPLDLSAVDLVRPQRLIAARRDLGHLHLYTRALAEELLARTGWQLTASRYDRAGRRRGALEPLRHLAQRVAPDLGVRLLGGFSWLALARRGTTAIVVD